MKNYELKRTNFKLQAQKYFAFLSDEFGYNQPILIESRQANGTVISDIFDYKNYASNKTVRVENHYHPQDYGFEINFWTSSDEKNYKERMMLEHCLKENQDTEQTYLENIAENLKIKHKVLLL